MCLKFKNYTLQNFFQFEDQHGKQLESRLRIVTDIDMLLMAEQEIKERTCHCINRYAKANISV